jgi:hypothetical protein
MFNFSSVDSDRQWLKNALLSDSGESSEEDADITQSARDEKRISVLLKQHTTVKRLRKNYHSSNEVNTKQSTKAAENLHKFLISYLICCCQPLF